MEVRVREKSDPQNTVEQPELNTQSGKSKF